MEECVLLCTIYLNWQCGLIGHGEFSFCDYRPPGDMLKLCNAILQYPFPRFALKNFDTGLISRSLLLITRKKTWTPFLALRNSCTSPKLAASKSLNHHPHQFHTVKKMVPNRTLIFNKWLKFYTFKIFIFHHTNRKFFVKKILLTFL